MNIRLLQDINLEDVQLKSDYYNYFINGNIDSAHQIIENNPQLKFKVLNAENLNKLIEYIIKLEDNYYSNVEKVFLNHIENYQISIDELIYLKDFDEQIQYEVNNFVLYNEEIYYCIKTPIVGILPTNSEYWLYLGLKGDESYPSLGVNYKGNWNSFTNYSKYDAVVYQNNLYVSINNENLNNIPSDSAENWSNQMKIQNQGIIISEMEPVGLNQGNIWIQII